MHDLNLRQRRRSEDEGECGRPDHPYFSRATSGWIGAAVGALGLIANVAGQNQQKKANARAQDANARLQDQQNVANWSNYLFSRGIAPTSPVAPGVLPQEGQYKATNVRLPLWATIRQPTTAPFKRGGFLIPRTA